MPLVIIRTDNTDADGGEEILSEYLCDCSGCQNTAVHAVGAVPELGSSFAVCAEHAARLMGAAKDSAHE